ncbi:response regulator [Litorivicinus lipolyticus]|uniref:Response regulator n=1 Tax=Litorivicinus lipolyticus TaxID=418701 RepID=A0A5Q2QCJ4_9GAMM|nr:response regulator [Litorivicinus lipolyticus]QGG80022.1 response regulator [Litorivicinus lipolyticus]
MPEATPIVYVVDDDPDVAPAIAAALAPLNLNVRSYLSGESFLAEYDGTALGVVLLDMRMPTMSGLDVQDALRSRGFVQPVIFTTAFEDVESAVQAMRHGAMDYLLKPIEDEELRTRIKSAIEEAATTVKESLESAEARRRFERLTPREIEVLALMVEGKANKIMSIDLGVSQRTVEIHRARVMEKMEARSLADLFRLSLYLDLPN